MNKITSGKENFACVLAKSRSPKGGLCGSMHHCLWGPQKVRPGGYLETTNPKITVGQILQETAVTDKYVLWKYYIASLTFMWPQWFQKKCFVHKTTLKKKKVLLLDRDSFNGKAFFMPINIWCPHLLEIKGEYDYPSGCRVRILRDHITCLMKTAKMLWFPWLN